MPGKVVKGLGKAVQIYFEDQDDNTEGRIADRYCEQKR